MKPLTICLVWDGEYPWDVRLEKFASTLTRHGHRVCIAARNRDGRALREELPEGTVYRMKPWHFLPGRLDAASQFPAFLNPRWFALIGDVVEREKADLVIVRDLPLAPTAAWVARRHRIPVMLDMAENYPAMIADIWHAGRQKPLDALVRNPALVRAIEGWTVQHVDHIVVVIEESRDRLVAAGVPADRITVVSNTPSRDRLADYALDRRPVDGPLQLLYLGLLEEPRGIGVMLAAIARAREAGVALRATIIGAGRDATRFAEQAAALALGGDVVEFPGFVPYAEALRRMETAHVGIVPHFASESWQTTIPNKLFDYMAAGLAVLSSDVRPVVRIVRSAECGEIFRDRDAGDMAAALERLRDPARRQALGAAGRRAIAATYNWEADSARLLESVERCAGAVR